MKRTDLEKNIGNKIKNKIQNKSENGPFSSSEKPVDKREQRKLDQAKGLVPFAVKINIGLVERIQNLAMDEQKSVNDVVSELLLSGLENRK